MTKKKGIFDVTVSTEILKPKKETIAKGMEIEKALSIIERQMKLNGYRERTLNDYNLIFNQFTEATGVKYLEEITVPKIYEWLDSMNVSNSTKLTRLKCV